LADPANPLVGAPQPFWDLRAAMNFVLGGLSSGLAVVAYLGQLSGAVPEATLPQIYALAAALMAVGLMFVFLKLGRKLRFLYVLLRPQSSWMSRETYAVAAFYPAVAADLLWPSPALHLLVAAAAAAFLYAQARILYASKGVPAWRAPLIPWMLVATGLYEGTAILALVHLAFPGAVPASPLLLEAGAGLAIVNAVLWLIYVTGAHAAGIGPLSRRVLTALTPWLIGIGYAVPFLVFGLLLIGIALPFAVIVLGVAAAPAGGVLWKTVLVTRACHQQGFALARWPRRGSGTRAAPQSLSSP